MTDTEVAETGLTIRGTFKATCERVYCTFVDPAELEAWFSPGDATTEVEALERLGQRIDTETER